jgi:hypothetical protein
VRLWDPQTGREQQLSRAKPSGLKATELIPSPCSMSTSVGRCFPVATSQLSLVRMGHGRQLPAKIGNADAVPLDFEEVVGGVEGRRRGGQHGQVGH